jgi:hypothetical protein
MTELFIDVTLEKSTGASWSPPSIDYFGQSYLALNAATSCSNGPGTFRTRVNYTLEFPPGFTPVYTASWLYSPWKSVACGLTLAAAPNGTAAADARATADDDAVTLTIMSDGTVTAS